jgi:uncharacterized protein (DUF305 family)
MKFRVTHFIALSALCAPFLLLSGPVGMAVEQPDSSHGDHHSDAPHHAEFHDVMKKMHKDMMAAPMKNVPDFDFVSMMIPHHEGAIGMAKVALKYGKDAEIRKMAQSIIDMQEKEIAEMKEWMRKYEQQSKQGD